MERDPKITDKWHDSDLVNEEQRRAICRLDESYAKHGYWPYNLEKEHDDDGDDNLPADG